MPISLPSEPTYRAGKFTIISNAKRFESPITRTAQSVGRVGNYWASTLTLPPMIEEEAYEWAAVLAQLAGGEESFYHSPPYRRTLGTIGTPRIKGAAQTGQTLLTDGWTAGYVLRAGSWLHYDTSTFRMLHITTADATADGSGNMSLNVRHAIRKSPPDNALLTLSSPSCEMVLTGADVDLLDLTDSLTFGVSFDCREDIRA